MIADPADNQFTTIRATSGKLARARRRIRRHQRPSPSPCWPPARPLRRSSPSWPSSRPSTPALRYAKAEGAAGRSGQHLADRNRRANSRPLTAANGTLSRDKRSAQLRSHVLIRACKQARHDRRYVNVGIGHELVGGARIRLIALLGKHGSKEKSRNRFTAWIR